MAIDLYLKDKLRGLFGAHDNTTIATEKDTAFNVLTEVERLGVRKDVLGFVPAIATATTGKTTAIYEPRTKCQVRGAKLIPQTALASNATNYVVVKLQRYDGTSTSTIGTAINTATTAIAANTAITIATLSNITCAAGTRLQVSDGATGSVAVPAFTVQLDLEDKK